MTLYFRRTDGQIYKSKLDHEHFKDALIDAEFPYKQIRTVQHDGEIKTIIIQWETETGECFGISD